MKKSCYSPSYAELRTEIISTSVPDIETGCTYAVIHSLICVIENRIFKYFEDFNLDAVRKVEALLHDEFRDSGLVKTI